ncbi:MAG: hypothetical protein IJF39_02875 [Clostridia bacterium]|nr:hypothetical protein [Clostridia bacterium]
MNTIKFDDKGNIKMIAHRGVSGLERENTCPAFVAAGVKSYYGIETDVHVTKDGEIIVIHDDNLMRVAGVDMKVEESNFDDLRKVRLKDVDEVTERADLFLPTLEEYISICKKYDKQAVLELKNPMQKESVWKIADITKTLGWFERVTFISFARENLLYLHEKYPNANAQFLSTHSADDDIKFVLDHRFDADFCATFLTKEKVDVLKAAGKKVNCWTVNTLEQAAQMKAFGVDMITTNILE